MSDPPPKSAKERTLLSSINCFHSSSRAQRPDLSLPTPIPSLVKVSVVVVGRRRDGVKYGVGEYMRVQKVNPEWRPACDRVSRECRFPLIPKKYNHRPEAEAVMVGRSSGIMTALTR